MTITEVSLDLSSVPTEDLFAEIQRRITLAYISPIGTIIPPPLRRETPK